MNTSLAAWRAARNEMLRTLDMEAARQIIASHGAAMPCDEVVLMSLHKGRYDCIDMTDDERRLSARWLHERGYGDMQGQPIDPDAELPR